MRNFCRHLWYSDSFACISQIPFQQESAEIRKGINAITVSNIPADKLNTIMDISIPFARNQGSHRLSGSVICLNLYRNQGIGRSNKEILFQRRIIPLVVIELVSSLNQRLSDNVFIKRAFIDTEVFVGTQVLLRLLVQHCNKQAAVRKIDLILCFIIINCIADAAAGGAVRRPFAPDPVQKRCKGVPLAGLFI